LIGPVGDRGDDRFGRYWRRATICTADLDVAGTPRFFDRGD